MALIDRPERARQLARAIASDLSLYHEKKLIEGIEKDTLFDVMRDEIDEGRTLYKSRVTPEIFTMGIYDRALVDMLLNGRGQVRSRICFWPIASLTCRGRSSRVTSARGR